MNLQFHPASVQYPGLAVAFRPPAVLDRRGLGATSPTSAVISSAMQGYGTALAVGGDKTGMIVGGIQSGISATVAVMMAMGSIPVAGPIIAGIAMLIGPIASLFKGCGRTCIEATHIADQAQTALEQVKQYYMSQPVHYVSVQTMVLKAIRDILTSIDQSCGNPALGPAGQRCISERTVRGGTAPWCPTPDHRGCDYWTVYYDPIANDPTVVPDPVEAQADIQSALSSVGLGPGSIMPLAIGAGALFLLYMLADDSTGGKS